MLGTPIGLASGEKTNNMPANTENGLLDIADCHGHGKFSVACEHCTSRLDAIEKTLKLAGNRLHRATEYLAEELIGELSKELEQS